MPTEELLGVHARSPLTRQILWNRGIRTVAEAEAFLSPDWKTDLHDPLQFRHIEPAADRIFQALTKGERITVHGDYDADGVTGSALLIKTLREIEYRIAGRSLEASCVDFYIPHRDAEGYGLHQATVNLLEKRGTKLLITVDCGIACVQEIAVARALGIDVIVIDHHQFGEVLPDAWLIHPGLPEETYPFKKLAAVGVSFKFASALLAKARERGIQLLEGWEKWLLDLVAIATVTDMVGLVGENRLLERYGLLVLRKTKRPGFLALFEAARIDQKTIDAESVGFILGPRLNAAGRMDHASLALRLLLAESMEEARALAVDIERCNRSRQEVTRSMMTTAETMLKEATTSDEQIQVLWHETWAPSLVGLVAGRLMERAGKPVIAIGKHGSTWIGSGRSPACFDVTKAMRVAGEGILTRVGGHIQACGFALEAEDRLFDLRERLFAYAEQELKGIPLEPELMIDIETSIASLDWALWEDLTSCEPFGQENPRPVFMIRRALITKSEKMSEGKHLRLTIVDESAKPMKCIAFHYASDAWTPAVGERVDIAITVSVNEWNGTRTLEGRIVDLVRMDSPAGR